jgi:hypothetical protein
MTMTMNDVQFDTAAMVSHGVMAMAHATCSHMPAVGAQTEQPTRTLADGAMSARPEEVEGNASADIKYKTQALGASWGDIER